MKDSCQVILENQQYANYDQLCPPFGKNMMNMCEFVSMVY